MFNTLKQTKMRKYKILRTSSPLPCEKIIIFFKNWTLFYRGKKTYLIQIKYRLFLMNLKVNYQQMKRYIQQLLMTQQPSTI